MILFLDFDGVLHPDPCLDVERLFENAPRLASILGEFPEVGIVFSTSWRYRASAEELAYCLPSVLHSQVLGTTPIGAEFLGPHARDPYRRQAECMAWLRQNSMLADPWLALDDRPDGFAPYCESLVLCQSPIGLDAAAAARLTASLRMLRHHRSSRVDLDL